MQYIPFEEAVGTMARALSPFLSAENAHRLATMFARNSAEGVLSHGINRFPRQMDSLISGATDATVTVPTLKKGFGALEAWDAQNGVGPLVATFAMQRAIDLAKVHGIGCVALESNGHWLRAGTYGRMATDQGMLGICFTNTLANMPAWGGVEPRVGNNPLVLAIPHGENPVIVDLAMSQFAYGKLEVAAQKGEQLPIPGGYDREGKLTCDPQEIQKTMRTLPIGYWKGSALSIALDLAAATLAMGRTTAVISRDVSEQGLSQTFIAVNIAALWESCEIAQLIDDTQAYIETATPTEGQPPRLPGANLGANLEKAMRDGVPVHEDTWAKVEGYAGLLPPALRATPL